MTPGRGQCYSANASMMWAGMRPRELSSYPLPCAQARTALVSVEAGKSAVAARVRDSPQTIPRHQHALTQVATELVAADHPDTTQTPQSPTTALSFVTRDGTLAGQSILEVGGAVKVASITQRSHQY